MKNGDFSKEPGMLLDPTTGNPFPGSLIPLGRISPIAQTLLGKFWPAANTGDLSISHDANYVANSASDIQSRQFDIKGDHYINSKQLVFARFSWKNATSLGPNGLLLPTTSNTRLDRSLVVSHNYTITPRIVNEFRLGYTSDAPGSNFSFDGKAFEKSLGFVGLPSTPFNGLPNITFSNLTGMTVGRVEGADIYRTFQVNTPRPRLWAGTTIKFGFDMATATRSKVRVRSGSPSPEQSTDW